MGQTDGFAASSWLVRQAASEKKNWLLLIEPFSQLINPQNYGHLDPLQVAFYYLSGVPRTAHLLLRHPPADRIASDSTAKRYFLSRYGLSYFIISYALSSIYFSMLRVTSTTPFDETLKPFALS
jgi:hypothetical protein